MSPDSPYPHRRTPSSTTSTRRLHSVPAHTPQQAGPVEADAPVLGSLCTGYGGLDLGVLAAFGSGRIAWCADPDPHIRQLLATRLPGVPNLGDLREIDWAGVEPVDVLTAGFPCQDISAAGRRAGIEKGTRSGLWTDIMAGLRLLQPSLLVVENVAALRWRGGGLHRVLGDLAEAGYDALWRSVRASDIGAAHRRERVFLLAWPATGIGPDATHPASPRRRQPRTRRPGPTPTPRPSGQPPRRSPRTADLLTRQPPPRAAASSLSPAQAGVRLLPTPRGSDTGTAGRRAGPGFRPPLSQQVLPLAGGLLPTPRASDGAKGSPAQHGSHGDLMLPSAISSLPPATGSLHAAARADWDVYTTAIRRWEAVLGRPVPYPTQPGRHGRPVLAPVFVEWLQGLPPGWVSDLPLPRVAQLRALGNGVVPQQAAYALALLLSDLTHLHTSVFEQGMAA